MSRSVANTCRLLSPAGRRVPVLAIVISARLDESGTHEPSRYTVVAGAVSGEKQWIVLERKWSRLLASFGLTSFHYKEMRARRPDSEYADWDGDREARFRIAATKLISDWTMCSIAGAVSNADYDRHKALVKGDPRYRRYRPDSRYGACFRLCLIMAAEFVKAKFPEELVSFVLAHGPRNVTGAVQIFGLSKELMVFGKRPTRYGRMLGGIAIESGLPSLEIADFIAGEAYRDLSEGKFRSGSFGGGVLQRTLADRKYFKGLAPAMLAALEHRKKHWVSTQKAS